MNVAYNALVASSCQGATHAHEFLDELPADRELARTTQLAIYFQERRQAALRLLKKHAKAGRKAAANAISTDIAQADEKRRCPARTRKSWSRRRQ